MFSRRIPSAREVNRLSRALASRDRPFLDLTVTNPTAVGLSIDERILERLADPRGRLYTPDPRGILSAREAVAAYYQDHSSSSSASSAVSPERLVLTASTSEAYSWIFKILCEPGDVVLVPAPSYPLLDALAALESVTLHRYPLCEEDGWAVHAGSVEEQITRLEREGASGPVKAVVLVNPNNPTGTSIARREFEALLQLALRGSFTLISDEVFLDYRYHDDPATVRVASCQDEALVFSLGGLSKTAALPQLKLGWILASGPEALLSDALDRLEWVADAFLSVGLPVQLALPDLLAAAPRAQKAIWQRVLGNAAALEEVFSREGPVSPLPLPAGWSAVLRLPALVPEEELVLRLLEEHDVLVHPGYFFEFPHESFLVLSLLAEPAIFREGVTRLQSLCHQLAAG